MVLHVTGGQVLGGLVLELGERVLRALAQGVDQRSGGAVAMPITISRTPRSPARWISSSIDEARRLPAKRFNANMRYWVALQAFGGSQAVEDVLFVLAEKLACVASPGAPATSAFRRVGAA